jgi:hypothetical protein
MLQHLLLAKVSLGNGILRVGAGSDAIDETQERGRCAMSCVDFLLF